MKKKVLLTVLLTMTATVSAGWQDFVKQQIGTTQKTETPSLSNVATAALSQDEMIAGLKQALEKGVGHAVDNLGQSDGFLNNEKVKIPMPSQLEKLEKLLRSLGQDAYADQFVESMNRAAEQAVPMTKTMLEKGVRELTIEDAKNILSGSDDAATSYLRKTGGDDLRQAIAPLVKQATDNVGVTSQYKNLFNNLGFMGNFMKAEDYDIDRYVTDQTLNGLFTMIAEQEKQIRENPVARTTDLLKRVFSY